MWSVPPADTRPMTPTRVRAHQQTLNQPKQPHNVHAALAMFHDKANWLALASSY